MPNVLWAVGAHDLIYNPACDCVCVCAGASKRLCTQNRRKARASSFVEVFFSLLLLFLVVRSVLFNASQMTSDNWRHIERYIYEFDSFSFPSSSSSVRLCVRIKNRGCVLSATWMCMGAACAANAINYEIRNFRWCVMFCDYSPDTTYLYRYSLWLFWINDTGKLENKSQSIYGLDEFQRLCLSPNADRTRSSWVDRRL